MNKTKLNAVISDLKSFDWKQLEFTKPNFFFVPKNFDEIKNYEKGFKVDELFENYNSGIQTKNDALAIQQDKNKMIEIVNDFEKLQISELNSKYNIKEGVWKTKDAKSDIVSKKFILLRIRIVNIYKSIA